MKVISEPEFFEVLKHKLQGVTAGVVTGPGRSGAIVAVYTSHILGIPFMPFGALCPRSPVLIVDTAKFTGRTLRKAVGRYPDAIALWLYDEPPRVKFWYEQRGRRA